jgi:Predicted aminopeptidases
MKKIMMGILTILLCSGMALAQRALPEDMAYKIKNEGFQRSQIGELAFWMTDYAGDRLTASQKWVRSEALIVEKLKAMGFQNVHAEEVQAFPRGGWDNQKTYVAMTAPYYCHFFGIPRAWTGSAKVSGEVILYNPQSAAEVEAFKGKLAGKIVLMPSTATYEMSFEPMASRYTDEELVNLAKDPRPSARRPYSVTARGVPIQEWQMQARSLLQAEKPAVIINGSGSFNVPRSSGGNYRAGDPEPVAELVLPIEAHGRMQRLIQNGVPVSMEIDIQNVFSDNGGVHNIIAEIPGTDPKLKDEVVLIGGHFDSWHGGTGAADNASGCIVMAEALRIIKESGIQPRRTIRLALWGGEEQGLYGSRGYVQNELYDMTKNAPKKGYESFALYLNMDNGSGKFRGIYLEENDMALPFMEVWTQALQSLGFNTLTLRRTGGTDHQSFDRYGLPAYQFIQDELEYDRGYHTPMDTFERLSLPDLTYNAVVAAWIALSAAMDDQKIPKKPVTIMPPRPMR